MSQHDLDIANQGFPATRADLNNALQALGSSNSGATAPSTTYANQLWYDTANNIIKIRNEDNDAWISLFTLDQTNDNIEALTINGTVTADALTVDTTTLHVDATNNRVGVGTLTPADHLAVVTSGANAQLSVDRSDGATGRTVLLHSSTGGQLQTTGSVPLIFGTADTERGRFLSGGGLTFNGDTAAANALDDYEEGTFSPTFVQGISVTSYSAQNGRYTKVGNLVTAQIDLDVNVGSATSSQVYIGNLPFTSFDGAPYGGGLITYNGGFYNGLATFLVFANTTSMGFYKQSDGGSIAGTALTGFSGTIRVTAIYIAA